MFAEIVAKISEENVRFIFLKSDIYPENLRMLSKSIRIVLGVTAICHPPPMMF